MLPHHSASTSSLPTIASSVPTSSTGVLTNRRRFDDRTQTAIAVALRSLGPEHLLEVDRFSQLISECNRMADVVKWSETNKISKTLNSSPFLSKFGRATCISLSPSHILVGTSKGAVAAFDYGQRLSFVLDGNEEISVRNTRKNDPLSSSTVSFEEVSEDLNTVTTHVGTLETISTLATLVTCIAFSSDGLSISCGHMDARITIWNISTATRENISSATREKNAASSILPPYYIIHGIDLSSEREGHLHGVPIVSVSFLDDLHLFLVSSDFSGLVVYHHEFKKFLRKHLFSEVILKGDKTSTTYDHQVLPVGTSSQITDLIGLNAVITSKSLKIFSVRSLNNTSYAKFMMHLKVSKSKLVDETPLLPSHGCLAWYPCLKQETGLLNAKLAYSWNNVVTILEINNNGIPDNILETLDDVKDKDKAIPIIPIFKTARWHTNTTQERIVGLKWLNSEILTVLVQNNVSTEFKLHLLYYSSFELNGELYQVGLDTLNGQQLCRCADSKFNGLKYSSYQYSLQIFRHRPVFLANCHRPSGRAIFTGTNLKWADRLMQLLVRKDFSAALLSAFDFFSSKESGKLILCGLPHKEAERHEVVEPFLVNIMKEAVVPLFSSDSGNLSVEYESPKLPLDDLLHLYFHLITILTQNRGGFIQEDLLEILEVIHEVIQDKKQFFIVLEEYILSQSIQNLSPILLGKVIEYFVSENKNSRVTEMVCLLDISTLNIDSTLKLCDKYRLRECGTYIWNKLLHDFSTPFITLMSDLDAEDLKKEEKMLVYHYLAYILSGRQFPTDDYLSEDDERQSKDQVCSLLFSYKLQKDHKVLSMDESSVFPYLTHLVKFSVAEMLMTLNEYFESPSLNDDGENEMYHNRQYIIEALIDIFDMHEASFVDQDRTYLAIFVARNYPKFVQFIRLSDSILQTIVTRLCENRDPDLHEDCELALQSLIQVYDAGDEGFFLEQLKAAKFHNVLFSIYKQKGAYSKAVEIWLKQATIVGGEGMNFSILADILESTFVRTTGTPERKSDILKTLSANFEQLAKKSPSDMIVLANTYCPDIHDMVLCCEDSEVSFMYLSEAFKGTTRAKMGEKRDQILAKYVRLLCTYSPNSLMDTINEYSATLKNLLEKDDSLLQFLEENQQIEAVCFFLVLNGKHAKALENLITGIQKEVTGDTSKLEKYIDAATAVCEKSNGHLWNDFVYQLVELTNSDRISQSSLEVLNQGIYQSFRRLLKTNEDREIFQRVLHDIMESAKISNVRNTLQELLTSYFFEIEMLNISLNKINNGILKYLHVLRSDALKGWGIGNKTCASCGLSICGKDVSLRHYMAWEDRERGRVLLGTFNRENFLDCETIIFRCLHGYHGKCLRGLSSWGNCVLCENLQPLA